MIYNYKTELRYPVPRIVNKDDEIISEETKETIKIMINKTNKKMKMIFALKRFVSNYDTPFTFTFKNYELSYSDYKELKDLLLAESFSCNYKCFTRSNERKNDPDKILKEAFIGLIQDNGLSAIEVIPSILFDNDMSKEIERLIDESVLNLVEKLIPFESKDEILSKAKEFKNENMCKLQEKINKKKEIDETLLELKEI